MNRVEFYTVVYTKQDINEFDPFELIILEGEHYDRSEISKLRESNKIVLAYLNVGEIETYRTYYKDVDPNWMLGKNKDWPDHMFINPSKNGWQNLLIRQVIPSLLKKGFQGFLLDSVDMASSSRFPEYKEAMVNLIKTLRKSYPEALLLLNNGGFLIKDVRSAIQGLLVEEIFTERVNDQLIRWRPAESYLSSLHLLDQIKSKWQLPVFVLEYFPTSSDRPLGLIFTECDRHEFIPYITDQYAGDVYNDYYRFKNGTNMFNWSN